MTTSVADNSITLGEPGGFGILVEDILGGGAASLTVNTVSLGGAPPGALDKPGVLPKI